MSYLIAKIQELRNLCGAERAGKAGCGICFQKEAGIAPKAAHITAAIATCSTAHILVIYRGIIGGVGRKV